MRAAFLRMVMSMIFHLIVLPIFSIANTLDRNSTNLLLQNISSAFRISRPTEQCLEEWRRNPESTRDADYCDNLDKTACSQTPSIRFDRTGSVLMPPRTPSQDYTRAQAGAARAIAPDLLPENVMSEYDTATRQLIGTTINNSVRRFDSDFRTIFRNRNMPMEQLQECSQKIFFAFLRVNRSQFFPVNIENFSYSNPYPVRNGIRQLNRYLGDTCQVQDQQALNDFLTDDNFRNIRERIDSQILEQTANSEPMRQIRNIFPGVQTAAENVIMRANISNEDKTEIIRRIKNTELGSCDFENARVFGEPARNFPTFDGTKNVIKICPFAIGSCRSEFCMVQLLSHELTHSFNACPMQGYNLNENNRNISPLDRHPLTNIYSCLRTQMNTAPIPQSFDICNQPHPLLEGFCDRVGTSINAEYFKNRNYSRDDFRRGFANAHVCYQDPNQRRNSTASYPTDPERVRFIMNANSIRSLMKCPELSQRESCEI